MHGFVPLLALAGLAFAACPYMDARSDSISDSSTLQKRQKPSGDAAQATEAFLQRFYLNDNDSFITTDSGTPIADQNSLSIGERGPTLLEDFVFRQKIQRFDHERVPERAVHARGAGAHGTFTSYGDFSNITAASFLSAAGKQTPVFVRFSTVAGSRGSADTARDVHGFATRFYTDEGNFDIVGNNIPIFFIQDAIQFPDLIHSVKPSPDSEIPQAATAHDSAWDFFSQQPSSMHTLLWAMSGHGIPRSFRHVDGFGVHTFRFVTADGSSKLVKFHFKSLQGKASILWEEAQVLAGKNGDMHREDLFNSIKAGLFPEWEFGVQIVDEKDELSFGFDLLDPTKLIPEDLVPITPLGKMQLNRNPLNYFAETEQVMFQPGHLVRGIDFTDDPLLQGRLFSYLDTQLNRNGGPNFEQLPINQPRKLPHNNNRDGAGQMFIPLNPNAYSPNTLSAGTPKQANQTVGNGFFTTPGRAPSGPLQRSLSSTFADVWSQPRLFYNSLHPAERQFLVNGIRFETSHLTSNVVKNNVIIQLNRVSNNLAKRVARFIGVDEPQPDPKYYHDNTTSVSLGAFGTPLKKLDGLRVGILSSVDGHEAASSLQSTLVKSEPGLQVVIVAETLIAGISGTTTYSGADATLFDGFIIIENSKDAFKADSASPLFPTGRPLQLVLDAYRYGKPIGAIGDPGAAVLDDAGIKGNSSAVNKGVFTATQGDDAFVKQFLDGLKTFRFLNRIALDDDAEE